MKTYSLSKIEELAKQLKRGPRRLRLKQLMGIEFLLSLVQADRAYPFDFVCHSLTGYRPSSRAGSPRADEVLDGDRLMHDLVHLAEDLSEEANIAVEAWPERVYSVSDLAGRFDVSTKTIFRWRNRGLIGLKFRYADRRTRVGFPARAVQRFVAANVELVQRGSSFSQLSRRERDKIVARATELVDGGEKTVNAVAKQVAAETGRAVETIRLILKSYDDAHPKAGVFNRSRLRVDADDRRLKIWEAYVDGASVETLAGRFEMTVSAVYGVVTQMRGRDLASRKIEYIDSEEFAQSDADERILRDPQLSAVNGEGVSKRVPAGLPPYLQQLYRVPLLSREREAALFRKMNYLKFKADQARKGIDPEDVTARELDAIEGLLDRAEAVKRDITQANLRLVVSIAKRHAAPDCDLFETISDGNVSLMRAVDKFDYSRGFKFSTYASWAIMKNYARTVPEQRYHRDRYQTGRDELLENAAAPTYDASEEEQLLAVRRVLEGMLDTLDQREHSILRRRFGLGDSREPETLEQIGRQFGVSKERIRQLEARAMEKLRTSFSDEVAQLLGV